MSEKTCLACKHSFENIKKGDHSACMDCNSDRNMLTPIQSTDTEILARMDSPIVPAIAYECERDEVARLTSLLTRMSEVGDEIINSSPNCCYMHERWHNMTTDESGNYLVQDEVHAPDCPVTRWERLKKEMEG